MSSFSSQLSSCQQKALELLNGAENIFLTGSAGSGKSFLVRHFLKDLDSKTFPVLASTGAAAVLVGGRTFHSFFGLGIMEGGLEATVKRAIEDRRVKKRLREINGFILDEVSMIPANALEAAETICRMVRLKNIAWGGARVIAVGDFAQLPPVSQSSNQKDWSFLSKTWEQSHFVPVVLKTIMRTEDEEYMRILNFVRNGEVNKDVGDFLDGKMAEYYDHSSVTHLFARRDQTETYNLQRLEELHTHLRSFQTVYTGDSRSVEILKKNAPVPDVLQIKDSALVMVRINDPQQRYVNGTTGTIECITDDELTICTRKGKLIELQKHTFSLLDAEGNEKATATNFPISLAYATTIHKSQGATLDQLVVNLSKLWEPGQAYVALSRLRSGSGLTLTGWEAKSIITDGRVKAFHESLG